ncbi:MAG: PAS domain S-box protein, partial [Synergistaceae bacterium]|nr:PAS domain S-box protein [Synergistaceae bacterium]
MKHPTNDSVRESKRAEEALRASEDRFRKVFENASIGILIADPNRNYLAVNDRFCEITGYSRETLLTLGCGQIVHPDDQEMDVAEIGRLIRGESKSFLRDLRYVHANGSIVWVRVHVSVFHSDSQEGIQIIAVVEDITDRKRAEESLRRFELIAEHSRDIVLFMRCDNGRLIEVNAAAENAYGYSREELLALSIHALRAAETQALTVSQMAEADVHGILFETIHRRKDGSTFPVEVSSQGATVDGVRMLISVVRDITERKEMKDALQESEESLNAIFNAAAQAIFLMNTSGIILAMNAFLSERIGHKPSEMLGRCIYDFLPADVAASRRARVQEVIRTGRMIRIEDQSEGRWFDSTIYPIIDGEGRVTRLAVFANDITEHKKAKEALRESEERFRSAFDKGAIPMTLAALDSRLLFVNAAFSKMLGYSEAELAEMSFFKITHPDDIAANQAGLAPVIRGEKDSFRMEKRYIRKDSRIIWADMSTSSVRDANGKPLYYVTYVQDTTERKLAEQALRESERRYRMLVDSAPDAVIVHREGRFLYSNALALKLYGAETLEQLQSKTVLDLVHPKYRETVSERMKRVEAGESVELKETAVVRFDGQVVPIESVASMMINYEGEPAVQVTIRDITERKRAEEVVRASTKKTETVLASITDMYVSYDNEWRFVDLNPVAEKLIGRTRQELIGKVLWEVFPQLRESEIHEHYLKAVRDKCTSSFEAYSPATGHWH